MATFSAIYLIVTLFVNFKHNFHKENKTFSPKKLKRFKEKSLKMEPFLSELPYHIYDWGHSVTNHPKKMKFETVPLQILMKIYTFGLYGQKRRFAK